jgi:hypothetical protein
MRPLNDTSMVPCFLCTTRPRPLHDVSRVQCAPCMICPSYDASLVRCVPWMMCPWDDDSFVQHVRAPCTMCPVYTVQCTVYVQCSPCMICPSYDASLVRCVPWMMCPWDDDSLGLDVHKTMRRMRPLRYRLFIFFPLLFTALWYLGTFPLFSFQLLLYSVVRSVWAMSF